MATSVRIIDCSHWNLRWKCTPSEGQRNTMDYDWLRVQSEQHLTTLLIETRLTKDILLDEIGETGEEEGAYLASDSENDFP